MALTTLFNATSWTGREETKYEKAKSFVEAHYPESEKQVAVMERVVTAPKIKPYKETSVMDDAKIKEYREVAESVGIASSDLAVEEFRNFLAKKDLPVFNLGEVVKYMDDLTAKDNPSGYGWQWCPVREKDSRIPMTWGRASQLHSYGYREKKEAASDFYESHRFAEWHRHGNALLLQAAQQAGIQQGFSGQLLGQSPQHLGYQEPPRTIDWRTMPSPVYTRTIPLHALKKIAMIEKEWTSNQVVFLVTDYVTAPHIVVNPDPFLMAVIPNSAVAHGKGRFIIDIWDEPGFGLDQRLIPA